MILGLISSSSSPSILSSLILDYHLVLDYHFVRNRSIALISLLIITSTHSCKILLVSYYDGCEQKHVSIVDDDTFPQHRVSVPVHLLANILGYPITVGTSHGLLCLYWPYLDLVNRRGIAVLWNVSIRKAVAVVMPNLKPKPGVYETVIGFGVCCETSDPKIVNIIYLCKNGSIDRESISSIPCQVEVFTLSTGVWRGPYSSNLPRNSISFSPCSEVLDGLLYWLADDVEPGFKSCNLIMSFDLTSEEFREVKLPDSLARPDQSLMISKLRESLIVLEFDEDGIDLVVWMMKDGVQKSFTKLFTINRGTYATSYFCIFRNSGEPIFEVCEDYECSQLFVYEPYSKHLDNLGIYGLEHSFSVSHYTETPLLLGKLDLTVNINNKTFKYRDDLFQELNPYLIKRKYFVPFLLFLGEIGNNYTDNLFTRSIYKIWGAGSCSFLFVRSYDEAVTYMNPYHLLIDW